MWILVTLGAYSLLAIATIADKFIVSNKQVPPLQVFFYSAGPLVLLLATVPWAQSLRAPSDWLAAIVSGGTNLAGMWAMYVGFVQSEVSHVGPLVGAAAAFFVLIFSQLFLREPISNIHYLGIALLVIGSLLISFERSKLHSGWHRGMFWGVCSGFCFALSNVFAKQLYNNYGFFSGFVWSRGVLGLGGAILLFFPGVRQIFFHAPAAPTAPAPGRLGRGGNNFLLVGLAKGLGAGGVALVQYASALASVAVVNALVGVQYALLVVLIAVFSRFAPRIFKEYYAPGEAWQEAIAILFIAMGMAALVL